MIYEVTLTPMEIEMTDYLYRGRMENAKRKAMYDLKKSTLDSEYVHYHGAGAEIAFCRQFNLYPDTDTNRDRKDLTPADAILPFGTTVDVKVTNYPNGHLMVDVDKADRLADVYYLAIGEVPTFKLVGWMTANKLIREHRIGTLGRTPTYNARQDELNHNKLLLAYDYMMGLGRTA